jgi:hypothetical protein
MKEPKTCNKCGRFLTGRQQKYCATCGPVVEREKQRECNKKYYRKRLDSMTPEQLEAFLAERRRYYHRHKKRCLNCLRLLRNKRGHQLKDKRIKYCHICRPIVEKQKRLAREQRFRDKHKKEIRKNHRKWCRTHREQKNLTARNYVYRHPEKHKERLQSWRKRNPDKVSLQNQRAKRNVRRRKDRNLRENGIYKKIRWEVTCPKCKNVFQTSAKRPVCKCGYPFTRRYMERYIDTLETSPCRACGREIPHQEGTRGHHRDYCDSCFPQIQALKRFIARSKNKHDNKKWYRDNEEIVVAVKCIFCDEIIPGHGGKKICDDCVTKWSRTTPRTIHTVLASWSDFSKLPRELLAWKRIMWYRERGIYSLHEY